jgi:hypothetical protein
LYREMKLTCHTHDKPKATPTMKYNGMYEILRTRVVEAMEEGIRSDKRRGKKIGKGKVVG